MRAQNTRLERSTPFFDGHGVSGHPDAQRLTSSHRSLWSVVAGPHAYVWLLEASFGATLGKAMVEIRVTRPDGRNAFAASAIRNLLRLVDGLGFCLVGGLVAGCSRFRQRLGDICAGTAVCGSRVWFWAQDRCRPAVDNSASGSWLGPPSHLCRERSGSSLTANLDTWDNPPFASGLNTITPSRFHVPPRLLGASHSTWTCPLDTSTFLHVVVCLRGIGDHRK